MSTKSMEVVYPLTLTLRQMQRLRQLVQSANAAAPNPDDHNLERRLTEFLANAQSVVGIGYIARRA